MWFYPQTSAVSPSAFYYSPTRLQVTKEKRRRSPRRYILLKPVRVHFFPQGYAGGSQQVAHDADRETDIPWPLFDMGDHQTVNGARHSEHKYAREGPAQKEEKVFHTLPTRAMGLLGRL